MARTRDQAEAVAWRVWHFVSDGKVAEGLDLLDDAGTWWDMATRAEGPMTRMKALLAEAFALVPIHFTLAGSIVEDCRVALMVEGVADLPDGGKYNNVYPFITTLHPDKDVIMGIREYVDTAHAYQTLVPAVLAGSQNAPGGSAMKRLLDESRSASLKDD